jgi:hypothetical protein
VIRPQQQVEQVLAETLHGDAAVLALLLCSDAPAACAFLSAASCQILARIYSSTTNGCGRSTQSHMQEPGNPYRLRKKYMASSQRRQNSDRLKAFVFIGFNADRYLAP